MSFSTVYSTVCRWVAKFKSRVQQLKDAARPGRTATTTTEYKIKNICDLLEKDARFTVRQLARFTNRPLSQVHDILKHLKLKKINELWIPHLLTNVREDPCRSGQKLLKM